MMTPTAAEVDLLLTGLIAALTGYFKTPDPAIGAALEKLNDLSTYYGAGTEWSIRGTIGLAFSKQDPAPLKRINDTIIAFGALQFAVDQDKSNKALQIILTCLQGSRSKDWSTWGVPACINNPLTCHLLAKAGVKGDYSAVLATHGVEFCERLQAKVAAAASIVPASTGVTGLLGQPVWIDGTFATVVLGGLGRIDSAPSGGNRSIMDV